MYCLDICFTSFIHYYQRDGGVLAALADTIAGFAAYTMTPLEKDVLTAELKMSFLRAAWGNELIAKGTVIKAGRNIHFCPAILVLL